MVNPRLTLLTGRQRQCLRLVASGQSSKEIAETLGGISHNTVDLHLKRAVKILGVSNRREAARLLVASEAGDQHIQGLGTPSPALANLTADQADIDPKRMDRTHFNVPFLRQGRQLNDLKPLHRLLWIGAIALLLLFGAANFLNGLTALYRIALG